MTATSEDIDDLTRALLTLQGQAEVRAFLDDLCTPSEIRAFAERFKVARLLDEGRLSYRDIALKTGASTTTVTRVARFLREMPHQGYRRVLDRLSAQNAEKNCDHVRGKPSFLAPQAPGAGQAPLGSRKRARRAFALAKPDGLEIPVLKA